MRANVSFGGSGAQRAHGEREAAPSGACAYDPVSTECHAGPATAGGSVSRPVEASEPRERLERRLRRSGGRGSRVGGLSSLQAVSQQMRRVVSSSIQQAPCTAS